MVIQLIYFFNNQLNHYLDLHQRSYDHLNYHFVTNWNLIFNHFHYYLIKNYLMAQFINFLFVYLVYYLNFILVHFHIRLVYIHYHHFIFILLLLMNIRYFNNHKFSLILNLYFNFSPHVFLYDLTIHLFIYNFIFVLSN